MVFSPFDFEKLCLKGGLEAKLFAFHFTTDNFQEKNRGREKIIFPFYITNGQNESGCHDFVSRVRFSLLFNGHFSSKTWYPLSKNFSCSWFPLYLAKRIRDRFCPRFLEKVSETAKQSLCIASNCPFYFPTDKMMRSITVLS